MRKLLLSSLLTICFTYNSMANTAASQVDSSIEQQLKMRESKIDSLSRDFETVMIGKTLKSLYTSVKVDPLMGGGNAEVIFRDLLLDEYAKEVAKTGGFGLQSTISKEIKKSDAIYQNLKRTYDEQTNTTNRNVIK